ASSGTPSGVTQQAQSATPTTQPPPPTTAPPKTVASACPFGFGNPPRQIESVYSPPCAPAFTGNNGGPTSAGVNATDINICYLGELTGTVPQGGEIDPNNASPSES